MNETNKKDLLDTFVVDYYCPRDDYKLVKMQAFFTTGNEPEPEPYLSSEYYICPVCRLNFVIKDPINEKTT